MDKSRHVEAYESSGNVFADLGLANPEDLLAKADAALRVRQLLREMALQPAAAAERMGISETSLSRILAGDLDALSLGDLFHCLNALDQDVHIVIKPKPSDREHGQVIVMAA